MLVFDIKIGTPEFGTTINLGVILFSVIFASMSCFRIVEQDPECSFGWLNKLVMHSFMVTVFGGFSWLLSIESFGSFPCLTTFCADSSVFGLGFPFLFLEFSCRFWLSS